MIRPVRSSDYTIMTDIEISECLSDFIIYDCSFVEEVDGEVSRVDATKVRMKADTKEYVLIKKYEQN